MTEHIETDICVIGGGSAGLVVAAGASQMGSDTVLIEKGLMGGDCLNYGCVPSKALIAAGRAAAEARAADRFGSQCVVVSIDHRFDASQNRDMVFTRRASSNSNLGVVDWAKVAVDAGAGEILLADADNDGSGKGLNVDLARSVAEVVDVPVIISGGCGTAQHFVEGFDLGRAEGIAAGTFFYFRDQNPMETRAHVQNAGIPIRIET